MLKVDIDHGDPGRDIKKEPLFSDDTVENETKSVDVKKTAVQDAVKEENVKCNCDGSLHKLLWLARYVAFASPK